MAEWSVDFEDGALNDLKSVSTETRTHIFNKLAWFCAHFLEVSPVPLGGEWKGFYKLRVGDYRVIYDIRWSSHRLIVIVIDHRSQVYRRKRR